jgi:hypothetical protein
MLLDVKILDFSQFFSLNEPCCLILSKLLSLSKLDFLIFRRGMLLQICLQEPIGESFQD